MDTMILRFADLGIKKGQTIHAHKEIIETKGHTWWGWWAQRGEKVPVTHLKELARLAKSQGLPVFLFHSRSLTLYRAMCQGIHWPQVDELEDSPEKAHTPGYYRMERYRLWFKLTEIKGIKKNVLRKYSYRRVDEFFERKSRFYMFYDKQVSSTVELQEQSRTIWFVNEYVKARDRIGEILLRDPWYIYEHFPGDFQQCTSGKLLWLSDLHCSTDEHHAFEQKDMPAKRSLPTAIKTALDHHKIDADEICGVIISGDLTWRSRPDEFKMATTVYDALLKVLKLEPRDLGICPGNHDLTFVKDPSIKDKRVEFLTEKARKAYVEHYTGFFHRPPNEYLCCGRRYLLENVIPVEIAFLNSSFLQQEKEHFQGHGFLGEKQMDYARDQMSWNRPKVKGVYRIVVLHHHVLPATVELPVKDKAYSVTLDAEAFARWATRCEVNLVLHGHMHTPFHTQVRRKACILADKCDDDHEACYDVVGMGSSGVAVRHLSESKDNMFAILDFSVDGCVITGYSVNPVSQSRPLFRIRVSR